MDTIEITTPQVKQWAVEARKAASSFDNEWDRKAVEWDGFLNKHSLVVECGSYKGRWALQISRKYQPYLYCFEPQPWAALSTSEALRMEGLDSVVYQFGLWHRDEYLDFQGLGTDGCTGGQMMEVTQALLVLRIPRIDLMMINIEGGEYTLIPHMFAQDIFPQRFMVQCHEGDYEGLRTLIKQHYTNLWDYGRTLTAWERKP